MDFYSTVGGKRFIEGTMPRIADALEKLASQANPLDRETLRKLTLESQEVTSELESLIDGDTEDALGQVLSKAIALINTMYERLTR